MEVSDPDASTRTPDLRPWVTRLAWFLVGLGVLARLVRYLSNRSLWRDEAALALNIVDRSFAELLTPLDYDQVAPLGFLWLARAAVALFGTSEYALRLVPLLAGLGSLVLFHRFVREFLGRGEAAVALALFGLSEPLIFYASEVKQYSSDVFVCLLVLWPGARILCRGASPARLGALAAAGLLGVWFSIPAVYTCGAVGGTLILQALLEKRWLQALLFVLISAGWLGSFAGQYFPFLKGAQANSYLAESWDTFMAPAPSFGSAALRWYRENAFALFNDPLGFPSVEIAALVFLAGAVVGLQRQRLLPLLLIGPVGLALVASMLGFMPFPTSAEYHLSERYYPFYGRLLLFLAPPLIAAMGAGLAALLQTGGARWAHVGALAGVLLVAMPVVQLVRNTLTPPRIQETRPLVAAIAAGFEEGDKVFTQSFAACPVGYYTRRSGLPNPEGEFGIRRPRDQEDLRRKLGGLSSGTRFWLVTLHHPRWKSEDELKDIRTIMRRSTERLDLVQAQNGEVALYRVQ